MTVLKNSIPYFLVTASLLLNACNSEPPSKIAEDNSAIGTTQSIDELRAKAEAGNPKAQFELGLIVEQQDYECSEEHLEKIREIKELYFTAAQQGFADAQAKMGYFYYGRIGAYYLFDVNPFSCDLFIEEKLFEDNWQESWKWFKAAADQNNPDGLFHIGRIAFYGNKQLEKNQEVGVDYYRKAANLGHDEAQYSLGRAHLEEKGTYYSQGEALKWFLLSAEQGNTNAALEAGKLLLYGNTVARDYTRAKHLFLRAAEENLSEAQYHLGMIAKRGLGQQVNLVEAYKWLNIAATGYSKNTEAAQERYSLEDQMTPEEIIEAQKLSKEWIESHK